MFFDVVYDCYLYGGKSETSFPVIYGWTEIEKAHWCVLTCGLIFFSLGHQLVQAHVTAYVDIFKALAVEGDIFVSNTICLFNNDAVIW